ncbi:hypothetical protein BV898_08901 [Hypsibius exemplaris]|uniref:Receptor ligand binding region domain-containing protein n=1 Tax=Hypsibius exemplaris TaxID=2072580 RepID=A0A1W0WPD0_HYPEX|nr:hypothetical protein BV898_08901 [Hypsibius exemplaris]
MMHGRLILQHLCCLFLPLGCVVECSKQPLGGPASGDNSGTPKYNIPVSGALPPNVPVLSSRLPDIPMGIIASNKASAVNPRWRDWVTAAALVPAIYQAILDAKTQYDVTFSPRLVLYDDCENGVYDGVTVRKNWDSYAAAVDLLFGSEAIDGIKGNLIVGPACTNDFLQVATATTAFPTNLIAAGGSMIDSVEVAQYPYVTRCTYNTFTQWNIFVEFAAANNWTTFAVLYDYSDSTATANAAGLISKLQKTAAAAAAGSVKASFKESHFPLASAGSNYTNYLVNGAHFSRSRFVAVEEA